MVYKLYAFDTLIWDKTAEFDEPYIYIGIKSIVK